MEFVQLLQQAIRYMEEHLLDPIGYEAVAKNVGMSSLHFHRIFSVIVGMTANEYIRSRRLSLAGQELQTTDISVIDAAYKYGYETPESFSKAFSRFHGVTPKQAKRRGTELHLFNPLVIKLTVEGGNIMNYRIDKKGSQRFFVLNRSFLAETLLDDNGHSIPEFWTACKEDGSLKRIQSFRPEGKRDLYGVCGPTGKDESHFDYGIGILIDEDTDVSGMSALPESGYSIWETPCLSAMVTKATLSPRLGASFSRSSFLRPGTPRRTISIMSSTRTKESQACSVSSGSL